MEEVRTLILWVLGFLLTTITAIGGWIFKRIFTKLEELETRQNKHELSVKDEFAVIRQELAINSQKDQARHDQVMLLLNDVKSGQTKIFNKLEEYDKNISNFYQLNPDIKNPEL